MAGLYGFARVGLECALKEEPVGSAEAIWIAEPEQIAAAAKEEKLIIQLHPGNDLKIKSKMGDES